MQLGEVVCDVSIFRVLGLFARCVHMMCFAWLRDRGFGCIRPSSCLVAGCTLLVGVVKMTGGSELAVASCSDCKGPGL